MSNHTEFDEFNSDIGSIRSSLNDMGIETHIRDDAKYIVHTSTVPLATVFDVSLMKEERGSLHNRRDDQGRDCCEANLCMFFTKSKERSVETYHKSCPCADNKDLIPICFLTAMKNVCCNLNPLMDKTIEVEKIAFCHNSFNLTDNVYPIYIREHCGITGWNHINTLEQLHKVLTGLYWYRKKFKYTAFRGWESAPISAVKRAVKQTLFTINGQIIKRLMALGDFHPTYRATADQTADLFISLLADYGRAVIKDQDGKIIEPSTEISIFSEMKFFANLVKEKFHKENPYEVFELIEYSFKHKPLKAFYTPQLVKLRTLIQQLDEQRDENYFASMAWIFRAANLRVTRVLGYLPDAHSAFKAQEFRLNAITPKEVPSKEKLGLIYNATRDGLREIPQNLMLSFRQSSFQNEEMLKQIIASIELVVKPAASLDSMVSQGGKLEDARKLLQLAGNNKWLIPVWDLYNKQIIKRISVDLQSQAVAEPLFWLSFQLVLNKMVKDKYLDPEFHCDFLINGKCYEVDRLHDVRIIHIKEPGKERMLVKSNSVLVWVLTPAGKILQAALGKLPEHSVGLLGSTHAWKHARRLAADAPQSKFLYDSEGLWSQKIWHYFSDWTEATDNIHRAIGLVLLKALSDQVAFPSWYFQVMCYLIDKPLPVSESISYRDEDGVIDPIEFKGSVVHGYMMGNPITKTILHLCHVCELSLAKEFLHKQGYSPGSYRPWMEPILPKLRKMAMNNLIFG